MHILDRIQFVNAHQSMHTQCTPVIVIFMKTGHVVDINAQTMHILNREHPRYEEVGGHPEAFAHHALMGKRLHADPQGHTHMTPACRLGRAHRRVARQSRARRAASTTPKASPENMQRTFRQNSHRREVPSADSHANDANRVENMKQST